MIPKTARQRCAQKIYDFLRKHTNILSEFGWMAVQNNMSEHATVRNESHQETFLQLYLFGIFCTFLANCWFSHDVTKIQTKKLSILPRFYFHDALQ